MQAPDAINGNLGAQRRQDYSPCENDMENMTYATKAVTGILHAADTQDVLTIRRYARLIGGARMGSAPENSVVDASQRAWAVPNLFISDGSVCPTQGSANPAPAIMALASGLAARMTSGAAMDDDPAPRSGSVGAARSGRTRRRR